MPHIVLHISLALALAVTLSTMARAAAPVSSLEPVEKTSKVETPIRHDLKLSPGLQNVNIWSPRYMLRVLADNHTPDARALTVEGFDFQRVIALIENARLNALAKSSLKAGLTEAKDDPKELRAVLRQIRSLVGG